MTILDLLRPRTSTDDPNRVTWAQRIAELRRIYGGSRSEVRSTAIGWKPSSDYIEANGTSPKEFYKITRDRKGK